MNVIISDRVMNRTPEDNKLSVEGTHYMNNLKAKLPNNITVVERTMLWSLINVPKFPFVVHFLLVFYTIVILLNIR